MTPGARLVAVAVAIGAGLGALPSSGQSLPIVDRLPVWFDVVAAIACVLGGAHLVAEHARRVSVRGEGWRGSAAVVAAFLVTLVTGLFKLGAPSWETPLLDRATWFSRLYEAVLAPALASLMALLPWFAAAAARRALRARVRGARIFTGAAAIVVLGHVPVADTLVAACPEPIDRLLPSRVMAWLLSGPVAAGERALLAGIALGAVAAACTLLLGRRPPVSLEAP